MHKILRFRIAATAIPITVALLTIPTLFAAPKVRPNARFINIQGTAKYALVANRASEQMSVSFSVESRPNAAFFVDLYVEPNSSGENCTLLHTIEIKSPTMQPTNVVECVGQFEVGTISSGLRSRAPLQNVGKGDGWTIRLVLREGNRAVSESGTIWVTYPGK